jgi:plasmid stabilization system protein ParE
MTGGARRRVIIRPEAEADITDAAIWYHHQRPDLGEEFLAEVEAAISSAAENPFRHMCLRRRPDAIAIIRVLHSSRHDREWKSRTDD